MRQATLGQIHSKVVRRKISKNMRQFWNDPKRKKMRIAAMRSGLDLQPNKPERLLEELLQELFPNQYKFVGDGRDKNCIIGGKNPDFIHISQKKIIEMNGDFWHSEKKTGRTKEEEEQQRIDYFVQFGYRTLIIRQHELKNISKLKCKIKRFEESIG